MGYRVMCYPRDGVPGPLAFGSVHPDQEMGTYYSHPSAAKSSALGWLKKHPGGSVEVLTYKDGALVSRFS